MPATSERMDSAKSNPTNESGREHKDEENDGKPETQPPEDIMEEFYRTGRGPDGLLMLDRKRGLRVCACCGGYISLVDAESRLLSHYGGKSHHSLSLLRAKVAELEKTLATHAEPASEYSGYRDQPRYNDREHHWQRRDDRRHSRWERPDRYSSHARRDYESGGHGTAGWYYNSVDRRHDRGGRYAGGGGRREERPYRHGGRRENRYEDRYEGRYESGRKRFRTPSPHRRNRRSRDYY